AAQLAQRHQADLKRLLSLAPARDGSRLNMDAGDAYEWTLYHLLQNEDIIKNRMFPIIVLPHQRRGVDGKRIRPAAVRGHRHHGLRGQPGRSHAVPDRRRAAQLAQRHQADLKRLLSLAPARDGSRLNMDAG
ncbi:hypothetical protein CTI14_45950, partial [Methylobacterium radiotolerans]